MDNYLKDHTIERKIRENSDTTERIKILCLWPDIDICFIQEYVKDGKVTYSTELDIHLSSVNQIIELLQKVRDEAQERVDEYVAYCEKEELKESESDANTNNIGASTDDFETLQLDRY